MVKKIDKYQKYLYDQLDYIFSDDENICNNKIAWSYIMNECDPGPLKFYEGIAKISWRNKYVFVNAKREIVGGRAFDRDEIGDNTFHYGFAIIKKDNKYNFINTKGDLLTDDWYDKAFDFRCGYARVCLNGEYYFIDDKGERVSEKYDFLSKGDGGHLIIGVKGERYQVLDYNGEPINDDWFDYSLYISRFDYEFGYLMVEKDNKYAFMDQLGRIWKNKWYTINERPDSYDYPKADINYFGMREKDSSGYAIVTYESRPRLEFAYTYIDKDHNPIVYKRFTYVSRFHEGFAVVSDDVGLTKQYYYIRTDGKPLNDKKYDLAYPFKNGLAMVQSGNSFNYIDANGELISEKWFASITDFDLANGQYAFVVNKKVNYIDTNGKLLLKEDADSKEYLTSVTKINNSFTKINYFDKYATESHHSNHHDYIYDKYYGRYKVVYDLGKFEIKNSVYDKLYLDYKPIAVYDGYALCLHMNKVILFNAKKRKYKELGNIEDIEYDGNFIYDIKYKKIYFMYYYQMIDITDYYEKKLLFKNSIGVKKHVVLYPYNEYKKHDIEKKDDDIIEVKKTPDKGIDELKEENNNLVNELEKNIQEDELNASSLISYEETLKEKLDKLAKYEKLFGQKDRIKKDNIFDYYSDYKEIKPIYFRNNLLRRIDLSNQDFKNAKISGIDFRGCNIFFNPQEIYEKDLSGCNFEGMYIPPFMDFTGVNLKGAKFSSDNDPYTKDYGSSFFPLSIYDETTTFDGIPFTVKYGECQYQSENKERRV